MNTFILVNSLRFLKKISLVTNLSTWIIDELIKVNNYADRLHKEIEKLDHDLSIIVVRKIIEFNIVFDKNLLLKKASEFGHDEVVSLLLDAGADITFQDNYALRWASANGHHKVVRLLLDAGADINAKDNYALRWSIIYNRYEVVCLLLDAGANIKEIDDYALRFANINSYREVARLLVNAGAKS